MSDFLDGKEKNMLSIKFYNELGQIVFGGGPYARWRLTAADGLAFPPRSFKSVRYANQRGQETTQVVINPRTVTLGGDIDTEGNFAEEYSAAMAVLAGEGVLEVTSAQGKRCIGARCCDFYRGEKKGRYVLFTVQFLCDDPYFEDANGVEMPIFKEIPLLDKDFSLPGVFSQRISGRKFLYSGSVETEPVFFVSVEDGAGDENTLSIINHTSGESLSFDYGASKNCSVTVDVKNRCICNSDGENLLEYLTDDSFFDGFHIYPGMNEIEVVNRNMNTGLYVTCSYRNRYAEAVYV